MPRHLPNDVARCGGEGCEYRENCARYRDKGGAWTPRFAFAPWCSKGLSAVGCKEFIAYDSPAREDSQRSGNAEP